MKMPRDPTDFEYDNWRNLRDKDACTEYMLGPYL